MESILLEVTYLAVICGDDDDDDDDDDDEKTTGPTCNDSVVVVVRTPINLRCCSTDTKQCVVVVVVVISSVKINCHMQIMATNTFRFMNTCTNWIIERIFLLNNGCSNNK
jgi:hypothetical protein